MNADTSLKQLILLALIALTAILLWFGLNSSPLRQQAEHLLDNKAELIKLAAIRQEAMQIRFDLAVDPVLQAIGVWNQGELIFPDQQLLSHSGDSRIIENQDHLTGLLQSANPKIWDRTYLPGVKVYYCSRATVSVCMLIDIAELATAMQISHDSLMNALFPPALDLVDLLHLLLVSVILLLAWRQFKTPQEPSIPLEKTRTSINEFRLGDMLVDTRRMRAYRDELCTDLSERDVKLLQHFLQHPDEVISKDELYNAAWGRDFVPSSRALEQHILTLRRKLDPDRQRPVVIETVHGQGYRFPVTDTV